MLTCRSISHETWEHARRALVFYFTRRHGIDRAEDLAQETLTTFWDRPDFQFEKKEDFLRVCYGFAENISKAAYRRSQRAEEPADAIDVPAREPRNAAGLNAVEMRICLEQIAGIAESGMRPKDWQIIQGSLISDRAALAHAEGLGGANNARVQLHRAIGKLKKLVAGDKISSVTDDAGKT